MECRRGSSRLWGVSHQARVTSKVLHPPLRCRVKSPPLASSKQQSAAAASLRKVGNNQNSALVAPFLSQFWWMVAGCRNTNPATCVWKINGDGQLAHKAVLLACVWFGLCSVLLLWGFAAWQWECVVSFPGRASNLG